MYGRIYQERGAITLPLPLRLDNALAKDTYRSSYAISVVISDRGQVAPLSQLVLLLVCRIYIR